MWDYTKKCASFILGLRKCQKGEQRWYPNYFYTQTQIKKTGLVKITYCGYYIWSLKALCDMFEAKIAL